jgi:hypothetical protein
MASGLWESVLRPGGGTGSGDSPVSSLALLTSVESGGGTGSDGSSHFGDQAAEFRFREILRQSINRHRLIANVA